MGINDLTDIAARINQIVADANGLGKPLPLVLNELSDFADELEDLFQDELEQMANEYEYARQVSETDLWYDTSAELR